MKKFHVMFSLLLISILLSSCTTAVLFTPAVRAAEERNKRESTASRKCVAVYTEKVPYNYFPKQMYWRYGYIDENGVKVEIKRAGAALHNRLDTVKSGETYWFNVNYYGQPVSLYMNEQFQAVRCKK